MTRPPPGARAGVVPAIAALALALVLHVAGGAQPEPDEVEQVQRAAKMMQDSKNRPDDHAADANLNPRYTYTPGSLGNGDISRFFMQPDEHAGLLEYGASALGVQNMVRDMFEQMDNGFDMNGQPIGGGGDGDIVREEMAYRVYSVIRGWQHLDDDEWVKRTDTDDDGLVDAAELRADNSNVGAKFDKYQYIAADKNKDGWLSEEEVDRLRNPLWHAAMHPWVGAQVTAALDANEDTLVSLDEFARVTNYSTSTGSGPGLDGRQDILATLPPMPRTFVDDEFRLHDTDNSKHLDLKEMVQFVKSRLAVVLTLAVDRIFQLADADADGKLSIHEMEAHAPALTGTGGSQQQSTAGAGAGAGTGGRQDSADGAAAQDPGTRHTEL